MFRESPNAPSYRVCLALWPFSLRGEAVMHKVPQRLLRILCRGRTWLGMSDCGVICLADGEPREDVVLMWCIKCFPAGTVPAARTRGVSSRDLPARYRAGRGANSRSTRRVPRRSGGRDEPPLRHPPPAAGRLDRDADRMAGRGPRSRTSQPLARRTPCAARAASSSRKRLVARHRFR